MIKYLWVLLFAFFLSPLIGQNRTVFDDVKLYLKDGSIYVGTVERNGTLKLNFRTAFGRKIKLYKSDIEKVETLQGDPILLDSYKLYHFSTDEGMYFSTDFFFSTGFPGMIGISQTIGKRINRHVFLGAGSGIVSFEPGEGKAIIPLFVELRGFLLDKRSSPYYAVRLGLGFGQKNDFWVSKAGVGGLLDVDLGYRFGGRKTNFSLGLGFKMQKMKWTTTGWRGNQTEQKVTYRRTTLKMGLMF